nr:immunoglobulin light chain junction region [Macaca mulatta]MOW04222.1 immunoglobulin light chain junction region [Macaca mulatta]
NYYCLSYDSSLSDVF